MSAPTMEGAVATIHRLPQSVADAIAAGEVVERPASVVKELCDNAVDAGARSIDVAVDGGGMVRIRVVDDGAGIADDQLGLAVARHATSKISVAADLEAVATLGFRGEALASIAAVADVALFSRPAGALSGARLRVRHGATVDHGSWGGPPGTSVEVLELFAATPARLRFLRGERTEAAAALAVVSDLALVHPELRVTCVVDGRTRLRSPGGSLDDALRCVYGPDAAELLPVRGGGDIAVGGAISEPRRHRGNRGGLVVVVNGRRVHNRALIAAVAEAYRGLVPARRFPFGVVSVALDPLEVDVNVHPTKREVRFRDERTVFAAIQKACWTALQGAAVYQPVGGDRGLVFRDATSTWGAPVAADDQGVAPPTTVEIDRHGEAGAARPSTPSSTVEASRTTLGSLHPLRAAGQQGGRWLLATSGIGVVVVDPHAAHEKVLYAALIRDWSAGSSAGQLLLIPALVECDARRLELFSTHATLLASCGFAVESFGPTTVRCTAVPAGAGAADPVRLVGDLIDSLGGGGPVTEQRHRAAALIACHGAVRFGDALDLEAQQRLLDDLTATPGGLTCPHGRPAVALFDDEMLRRIFRRPPG